MSDWHRPDVETSALNHLTAVVGPVSARQIVDGLIGKGFAAGLHAGADLIAADGTCATPAHTDYYATLLRDHATSSKPPTPDTYASTRGEPRDGA